MRWLTRFITLAVLIALIGGTLLLLQSRFHKPITTGNYRTWALFRDSQKITVGSPVLIAGVRVGIVSSLGLDGGMARVDMRLRSDLVLPVDSWVTRRDDSLFGDAYVEIIPGEANVLTGAGDPNALRSGDPIKRVIEGASTDAMLRSTDRAMVVMGATTQQIAASTADARKWILGTFYEQFNGALAWLEAGQLSEPIRNLEQALFTIEQSTTRAERALAGSDVLVASKLDRLEAAIASTRQRMGQAAGDVTTGMTRARRELDRLDQVIDDAAAYVDPNLLSRAGQLGAMLDDPTAFDEIADMTGTAAVTARSTLDARSLIGLRTEYDIFGKAGRVVASARMAFHKDKFYLGEATIRPQGTVETNLAANPDGTWRRTARITDRFLLSAQIGKRVGRFAVRGGLKESTLGVGFDAGFRDDRLMLSADLFGSPFSRLPNLRLTAALAMFRSIYVVAGVDQALTARGALTAGAWATDGPPSKFSRYYYGRDVFVGGMLRFTDEDLASLLMFYGSLVAGLL